MNLLSLAMTNHDGNLSYFDGKEVKYLKFERTDGRKHLTFYTLWELKNIIEKNCKIDIEDFDDVVINMGDTYLNNNYMYFTENLKQNFLKLNRQEIEFFKMDYQFQFFTGIKSAWYVDHHLCHSLSYWMMSEQNPKVKFIIDGKGDGTKCMAIYVNDLLNKNDLFFKNGLGFIMEHLGNERFNIMGHHLDGAGKLMGLQSYGEVNYSFLKELKKYNLENCLDIFNIEKWYEFKGSKDVGELTKLNWIKTIHVRIGEILVESLQKYANADDVIFYSGGVAQNIIWNSYLREKFPNIIIPPHSNDDGISLGGLEWLRRKHNIPKFKLNNFPYIQNDQSPQKSPGDKTIKNVAKILSEGKIVGWYQGNGEIGPRALGNRSILMDPRITNGKEKMNEIKCRETYRPFGASVLEEYSNYYFDMCEKDEYMLFTSKVKDDKLSSITHVDGTCRVQTVGDKNPLFRKLLEEFYKITGCAVLLNTSMNLSGEPIYGNILQAKSLLLSSPIDCVVIGDEIFLKE